MTHYYILCLLSLLFAISFNAFAEQPISYNECLLNAVKYHDYELTLGEVRSKCKTEAELAKNEQDLLSERMANERKNAFNPYVITPHRMNYILPVTYTNDVNKDAYAKTGWEDSLKDVEAKFQISFKVPLNYDSMFVEGDGLFFGITLKSWWQVYADDISSPFRETNYRPEMFYFAPTPWTPLEGNTWVAFGIEHESNGRSQELSRSWNRIYTDFVFEKNNFALSLRPWWRIPEDEKETPESADGDDNPDLEDYMGHFELSSAYRWDDYEFTFLGRQNFSEHKGYAELGLTFPLWGRLRGYAQYTTGYGESLIDYNHNQQRIGVGIALTDML
ncbi:phospholipase A [Photobacterium indicum]|uniref:Phospholipase A1 n=1 Tax=Photobacterium indicum TaxID=81447 RepID=A0A2T3LAK3_9GAMM|nr:phospholipase A [Photobacterium indicum]PSV48358.1 phospholipase [Photobacterium indicum]